MKISCNALKKYIKNSNDINFLEVWDNFTIRVAEVEGVEIKGEGFKDIVVAEIVECKVHPKKDKYHILKVNDGEKIISILCGAPNVRVGLKCPLVKVGGMIQSFEITEKEIAGVLSQGMLCAEDELNIGDDHTGILELSNDCEVGRPLNDYIPMNDIIVEIDNKSLTNRPDLWGHYGIAREVAAITNHELLPLDVEKVISGKGIDIQILNPELCPRYIGLQIDNISIKETPWDIKVFLYYTGMRSISLLVDLTNYLMLELGTPMHAFDSRGIDKIEIGLANDQDTFITLDNITRTLDSNTLMIKNNDKYFAIAGVMGGLDSEIKEDTTSIILESANFDATSVRKTATRLGLRTEASARYEKSLDPNLNEVATKRFVYLLKQIDSNIEIKQMNDVYVKRHESIEITLSKDKLNTYMGFELDENVVEQILRSLEFKVKNDKNEYKVTVPTFRCTKDITLDADLIEEVSRMYGYDNIEPKPLQVDLLFNNEQDSFKMEYETKKYLAVKYNLHEIHSYLWYKTNFLKKLELEKDNIKLAGKVEDNILRDDLNITLLEYFYNNSKNMDRLGLFEIGTIIQSGENKRCLSLGIMDADKNLSKTYNKVKNIVYNLFKSLKNIEIEFNELDCENYYNQKLSLGIYYNNDLYGTINVFNKNIIKKKIVVFASIDFDKFYDLEKKEHIYKEISKYPEVTLDYTIITPLTFKYQDLQKILEGFNKNIIINYQMIDLFKAENELKWTIRYIIGLYDRTLVNEDLTSFKESFIKYIKDNNLTIIE